ncbi:hypothetical protein JCM8208_000090 [Rhodotorula glutinis]
MVLLRPCCVCTSPATITCERCEREGAGIHFCSLDHQALVWPVHKHVCGRRRANPLRLPDLSNDELDHLLSVVDLPLAWPAATSQRRSVAFEVTIASTVEAAVGLDVGEFEAIGIDMLRGAAPRTKTYRAILAATRTQLSLAATDGLRHVDAFETSSLWHHIARAIDLVQRNTTELPVSVAQAWSHQVAVTFFLASRCPEHDLSHDPDAVALFQHAYTRLLSLLATSDVRFGEGGGSGPSAKKSADRVVDELDSLVELLGAPPGATDDVVVDFSACWRDVVRVSRAVEGT